MNKRLLIGFLFMFVLSLGLVSSATITNEVYIEESILSNACMKHSNGYIYCGYEGSTTATISRCDSDGTNCIYGTNIGIDDVSSIFERDDGYIVVSYIDGANDGRFLFMNEDLSTFSTVNGLLTTM